MPMVTKGFHHIAMVSRNVDRTADFYGKVLGLTQLHRLNAGASDPERYRLIMGDRAGSPGSLLAFYEWPDAPRGRWGVGGIHHLALGVVDEGAQLKWKRWLTDHGVRVGGPYNRGWFRSIYFQDPDGQILEIATEGPGFDLDEPMDALGQKLVQPPAAQLPGGRNEAEIEEMTHPEPVAHVSPDMVLRGIHHITGITADVDQMGRFYEAALGLRLVKRSYNQDDPDTLHYFWANYDGTRILPHSDLTMFGWPRSAQRATSGAGQTHHIAFRAPGSVELGAWRDHLLGLGLQVSPITERGLFQSIIFQAPDGLLMEMATDPAVGGD